MILLFVVSEALDATGVTSWAGAALIDRVGESRARLVTLTMLLGALLTALITVNGAVAALLPVAVVMAVRLGRSPSQLLMPLAFGAHAGSLLVLTGMPVNRQVKDGVPNSAEVRTAGTPSAARVRLYTAERALPLADRLDAPRRHPQPVSTAMASQPTTATPPPGSARELVKAMQERNAPPPRRGPASRRVAAPDRRATARRQPVAA